MILNKKEIKELIMGNPPLIENFIDLETQLQPAGIDLTVNKIEYFNIENECDNNGVIDFDNTLRKIPRLEKVLTYNLKIGTYKLTFNEKVNIPKNIVGLGRPRSTLFRCGCTISSGIWDSGYSGTGQALLIVNYPISVLENARIFQLQFVMCNDTEIYNGIYQNK